MNATTTNANTRTTTTTTATDRTPDVLPSAGRVSAALAVLRVVVGTVFVAHGAQKLFVFGLSGVAGAFAQMGVPLAELAGPTVAFLEFLGGLALVAGIFTRVMGAGLATVMMGAMLMVHLPAGFFAPAGVEFPLTLFGAAVALALTGPGAFSVDGLRARREAAA
jgi:putative oxidoreductase